MHIKSVNIKSILWGGLLCLTLANQASAVPLPSNLYVGSITDGVNASSTNETNWINKLITISAGGSDTVPSEPANKGPEVLVRSANTFTFLPTAVYLAKDEDSDLTLGNLTGVAYLLGKYGNGSDEGQQSLVWYVGGLSGTGFSIPITAGLSHVSYFSAGTFPPSDTPNVPEGGASVALLGVALAAVACLKRKL